MNIKDVCDAFNGLNFDEQKYFLSLLAHNITVVIRDLYPSGPEKIETSRVIALNEAQHRVTSQLMHKLKNEKGYSPEDFFEIILSDDNSRQEIMQAIQWSFKVLQNK